MNRGRTRMGVQRSHAPGIQHLGFTICLLLVLALGQSSMAESVDGVRPAVMNPIAPRGGVMMIPLTAERAGDNWPRTLDVELTDGSKLVADVAWVHLHRDLSLAGWTTDPRRLAIRAVERADDTSVSIDSAAGEGPYLLVRLPAAGDGPVKVEGATINPIWCDAPWTDPLRDPADAAPEAAMSMQEAPDRPDVQSPFEYWRWVLLADRLGLKPPAPPGDDLQRLAAEHYAVLWRLAMQRLTSLSSRIAHECRHMLTRTAVDRSRIVATWIVDPKLVASLQAVLLDFSLTDQQLLSASVAWLGQQPSVMAWPEDLSGDQVRLTVTSLRDDAIPLRLAWVGFEKPAAAVQLEPGIIAHMTFDRLPLQPSTTLGGARLTEPATQTLRIASGETVIDMPCGPRVVEARPPGVSFQPAAAPLTLADVQFNRALAVPLERSTFVQIRRLGGRWEAFVECRRLVEKQQLLDRPSLRTYDDLRGIEAITLLLGREDGEGQHAVWLTVAEHDWPAVIAGEDLPDLQVHKRSFGDRWYCRIVLPERWFSAAETNPAFVAFIRSHGDDQQLETGPVPSPAWRAAPGRMALDLSRWDDLPTTDE
ncbi:MAG TPA: hypothetical protein VMS30_10780 [Phycisphaerales bacterium]|nr:hypothetical protein [Phycisphaerales bacterium]